MNRESVLQFIKFCIVGVLNTVISYITYCVFIRFNFTYLIANIFSYVIGMLNSFFWNNKYVFKDKEGKRIYFITLLKTFVAYSGTGIVLSNILLFLWINCIGINEYIAPMLNLPITTVVNFLCNKYWAYKTKNDCSD